MTDETITDFLKTLWEYYAHYGRHDLPWRQPESNGVFNPYKILVSELMLQQTQVSRVIPKYHEFLAAFPTVAALATAPLGEVLICWSGLGYNRRAKYLQQAAQRLHEFYHDTFPSDASDLMSLPGVGSNTAGAIQAYAFNKPVIYIETNIRTVYIHHFFRNQMQVRDAQILAAVETTLDSQQPRDFYWALMDYGSHLKQTVGNLGTQSDGYKKQSTFQGSRRQLRGQILRLLRNGPIPSDRMAAELSDARLLPVLDELIAEGLIQKQQDYYHL